MPDGRKKTCNGGHRTRKKGASTDPKKHFEVINFILGHFVNFLDISSPLILKKYNDNENDDCSH